MATFTASMVLLRWQLLSAVLMFMASTLNIRFRKADYLGLAVISSGMGLAAACWFATGLLGMTTLDLSTIWHNIVEVMIEASQKAPPDWPMVVT
ncbi:YjcB family protein [Vagococcus sp. WN89Y]|uniref:YjcB family protein n=1 Tax=Vagococcus sp. WN89Y TaxID=3457258 RepID=UPI003FCD255A